MIASYEFHASHGGWHVHSGCGQLEDIPVGRYKGPWKRDIPSEWEKCRRTDWGIGSDDSALAKACEAFGIPPEDDHRQLELLA